MMENVEVRKTFLGLVSLKTLTAERKLWKHETIFYDKGDDTESPPNLSKQ